MTTMTDTMTEAICSNAVIRAWAAEHPALAEVVAISCRSVDGIRCRCHHPWAVVADSAVMAR